MTEEAWLTAEKQSGSLRKPLGVNSEFESNNKDTDSDTDSIEDGSRSSFHPRHEGKRSISSGLCLIASLLVAAGAGFLTFFILDKNENEDFESEFRVFAQATIDYAENKAENAFGQLATLSTAITSEGLDAEVGGDSFPNITIPHFGMRTRQIVELIGADMILFVPFVEASDRTGWNRYKTENQWWIQQDFDYPGQNSSELDEIPDSLYSLPWFEDLNDTRRGYVNENNFMGGILDGLGYESEGLAAPISQYGPGVVNSSLVKLDLFAHQSFKKEMVASLEYDVPVISEPINLDFLLDGIEHEKTDALRSFTLDPVKEDFREDAKTIGFLVGIIPWDTLFADANLLPDWINGIQIEVGNDCGGNNFTYILNGGRDDETSFETLRDPSYNHLNIRSRFFWKEHPRGQSRHCHFDLVVYPSNEFEEAFKTNTPIYVASIVAGTITGISLLFLFLRRTLTIRQMRMEEKAQRAEAIVASVFPQSIGEQLLAQAKTSKSSPNRSSSQKLASFLTNDDDKEEVQGKPIADLFLETTIIFADIVGFTAWSSTREPSQVFVLLETIYKDFDKIAARRGIYKVETVGDCYVAVAGLPVARRDHAVAAAKFAFDILARFNVTVKKLELSLGPDTGDLGVRIGMHSGPVTAGVLRGERARFQLFGDTVNTTSRMESTGKRNRIQISQESADLLKEAGKESWYSPRLDKVDAKGKGQLQTFWLDKVQEKAEQSVSATSTSDTNGDTQKPILKGDFEIPVQTDERLNRLIDWNVGILSTLLKRIQNQRQIDGAVADSLKELQDLEQKLTIRNPQSTLIEEVVEIVNLPPSSLKAADDMKNCDNTSISPMVLQQLHDYVSQIARMYNPNSFHNFEHASHVTMSITKLLGRIIAPETEPSTGLASGADNSYGITSDPLTQFTMVLSGLLHDVDHQGVPNTQLVQENDAQATIYKRQSVAEQNSIDLSWNLLMEERYKDLRLAIYSTEAELKRFRELLVNTVLATDIMDPSLKQLRNERWERAFASSHDNEETDSATLKQQIGRKATIVMEHLIQASDVAHTMQHWQVYKKWNTKLFKEMYKAYLDGRSEKDPLDFWYEGEKGFFDFYVFPLAKKLEECGVFGVSSHEYLSYAVQNRQEWEAKGSQIVDELREIARKMREDNSQGSASTF